ncbi:MAG: ABC transporter substrate-binding protein [Kiritimatiellia bacterium]|jgi:iron(III) transport system substrate-binding protein
MDSDLSRGADKELRNRRLNYLLAACLIALLTVPFLLRPADRKSPEDAARLVIISPHNEAIRFEFGRGFDRWHRARYGQAAAIDWRNIGGTSEIARYLDSEFAAAEQADRSGIGIDLFFGGGQYDHSRQTRRGHILPSRIRQTHPAWFTDAVLPTECAGETFYDSEGHWFGCCLSSFGICYNRDVLAEIGITNPPTQWPDLADARYFRRLALADPTKSGSINKAFEVLIQSEMAAELNERGVTPAMTSNDDLAAGWRRAWTLLRCIGANARYFTDAASKVPLDVAQGNAAAGMCIDFYGRFENETIMRNEKSDRMQYITPAAGSGISVDPVSILRGAPHLETAERFIEFCLSPEGQKLWNYRPGAPGGPETYAIRRLPIRRDMYSHEHSQHMSDPDAQPYERVGEFVYRPEWTSPLFNKIRILMRAMCLDTQPELTRAWEALQAAGGPESAPEAAAAFFRMPPDAEYANLHAAVAASKPTRTEEIRQARDWMMFFLEQYRETVRLAERL